MEWGKFSLVPRLPLPWGGDDVKASAHHQRRHEARVNDIQHATTGPCGRGVLNVPVLPSRKHAFETEVDLVESKPLCISYSQATPQKKGCAKLTGRWSYSIHSVPRSRSYKSATPCPSTVSALPPCTPSRPCP